MSTSPKHIRNAIRYNSVGLFLTDSPAHKPDSDVLTFLNRVQTATFNVSAVRQDVAQIGSDDYLARKVISQPTIDLSFQYFLTDGHEEHVMGLNIASGYDPMNGTIHKGIKEDKSAYFLVGEEPFDLVSYYREDNNFEGTDAAGFGNCFITNYSVSASVGSFATANVSMACSNMTYSCVGSFEFERELKELASLLNNEDVNDFDFIRLQGEAGKVTLQGDEQIEKVSGVPIPSLDLTGRASIIEGTGYVFDPNIYKSATSAIAPGGITIELDNLEFGGPIISGDYVGECSRGHANIQAFDLSVPFEREDLYGMESLHVYGRRLKLPQIGALTIELLSSAFNTGNIKPMLCSDREYKIDLLLNNSCTISCLPSRSKDSFMRFVIDNAKFESYSLNAGIGGSQSTVSCSFTFCVGTEHGVFASGSFPNWRDDKCTPSQKHTPHDFDITRVLEDVDAPEDLEVIRVLDESNIVEIDIDRLK
jgi:hypothetical protein